MMSAWTLRAKSQPNSRAIISREKKLIIKFQQVDVESSISAFFALYAFVTAMGFKVMQMHLQIFDQCLIYINAYQVTYMITF